MRRAAICNRDTSKTSLGGLALNVIMATGLTKGQRFVCQNPECGCEVEIIKAPAVHVVSNSQTYDVVAELKMKKPSVLPSKPLTVSVSGCLDCPQYLHAILRASLASVGAD
jgi:hypothetical protein